MPSAPRILIVNPFGIGDAIFSMIAVAALRRQHPEAFIGFIANERSASLVRLNTDIDRTFIFDRSHFRRALKKNPLMFLGEMMGFWGRVREERFDTLLDFSLGREFSFYALLCGIRRRVGFDYKKRGTFLTQKKALVGYGGVHAASAQLALLDLLGVEARKTDNAQLPIRVLPEVEAQASDILKKAGIAAGEKFLAVAPGGGRSWGHNAIYKQWEPDRFAEVARRLAEKRKLKLVFLGDEPEKELLEKVAALSGRAKGAALLAGESMEVVCAVLRHSEMLLCNDGGLLHLANSLGVKTVSVYGPVDPIVYGPYGTDVPHAVVTAGVDCQPCYKNFYFPVCGHARQCLESISVEQVLARAEEIV